MNQYEAMILFDPTFGAQFENCEAEVRRLMERAGAELVFCKKWDERRLAYKVKGRKRGLYVLAYFKAPADKIAGLERDCQISENILRVLVTRADDVGLDAMEKAVQMRGAEAGPGPRARGEGEPEAAEFEPYDDEHRGRRRGRRPEGVGAPGN